MTLTPNAEGQSGELPPRSLPRQSVPGGEVCAMTERRDAVAGRRGVSTRP
jgi:hypothetical protein